MKINHLFILPLLILVSFSSASGQEADTDSTGLPGDNFSLQGALQMFQKAGSPEEFEKLVNSADNNVNNLDLDGDGETDYIRVIDKTGKNVHALVLQVPVSGSEAQDIAVIEIEKTGDTTAVIQIIGDEDIYGEEKIVEPAGEGDEDDEAFIDHYYDRSLSGPNTSFDGMAPARIIVNVWFWPSVRFVYAPVYRPWISPWRWHYYPAWWKPWRPLAWNVWRPRPWVYHRSFVVVHTHRAVRAHAIYRPARVSSVTVRARHASAMGNYRVTRSKTTVTGRRGHSATHQTTTIQGPRGNKVKTSRTTVRRRRR